MPRPEDQKDALPKTPSDAEQQTTPLGEPERREAAGRDFSDSALRALTQRYDILAEVGRGGMGIVYKARDRETDEVVALKVLKPEIAARPDVIERFKAELRLARKITHKNVCRTYELLRFGDTVVIAMEYVEGESLRAFLGRYGTAPLRRGLEWATQICEALGEAHAQGIAHRDLKPENIVIDRRGQAKVMDFGIARSIETDATHTATLVGTPAYMSPEQAEGKPPDPRSDIYALGLILYETFVGRRAFNADTPVALVLMQIKETPPSPRSIEPYLPGFLDRAIQKCLEKNPTKRFQSVAELHAALGEKEVLEAAAAQIQLPSHLVSARRSDLGLFGLGVLGLTVFMLFAPHVIPEMGIRVQLTREMLLEKARNEMTRRGQAPTSNPWLHVELADEAFKFVSERVGYATARSRIGQDFCPYLYDVDYGKPENPFGMTDNSKAGALVVYDPAGMVRTARMPIIGWVPQGEGLPREKALDLGKQEIQRTFGVDPSQLAVENEAPLAVQGRHGYSFLWVQRDPTGIQWHYQADIFDRPTLVKRWSTVPEDYRSPQMSFLKQLGLIVGIIWSLLAFVLFFARRVFSQIHASEFAALSAIGLVSGIGFGCAFPTPEVVLNLILVVLYSGIFVGWFVVVSSTVVFLAQRRWAHVAESYSAMIQLKPAPRAAGLAVVRGAACGLFILGLYAALLRLGLFAHLIARPPLQHYLLEMNSPVPGLTLMGLISLGAAGTAYFFGFFLSLARRWTSVTVPLVVIGALLWVPSEGFPTPSVGFHILLSFATGAAFAWVLVSFDLLTLLAAAFTFVLWQRGFALIPMFQIVGNWQYWFPFLLWGALLAWSVFAGFRPLWSRAGRRLAEVFE